jgi:hypothetical protein
MATVNTDTRIARATDHATAVLKPNHTAVDWWVATTARPNVLVTGRPAAAEQALAALMPYLDAPVGCWAPDTSLPSSGDVRTLVIRNLDELPLDQQRALSSWLQGAPTRTHVVSTATVSLFQLVTTGRFLEVLYYRLNTLLLDANAAFERE